MPLHGAAAWGHGRCVAHLLIADDGVLALKDGNGRTPLAAASGRHAVKAGLQQWMAGDKAGALARLGASDLVGQIKVTHQRQAWWPNKHRKHSALTPTL